MIKSKIAILLTTSILLTGCFGSSDGPEATSIEAGKMLYEGSGYQLIAPEEWEIIEKSDFTTSVPQETQVAFRNNIKSEIFTANVNVLVVDIDDSLSAEDFAISSKTKAKSSLISFTDLGSSNSEIPLGEITIPITKLAFSGKKTASETIIKFEQLYAVKDGLGYILTAAYLPEEDESVVKYMNEMLDSFSLK